MMPSIFKDYKIKNCNYKIKMQMKKKVGQENALANIHKTM